MKKYYCILFVSFASICCIGTLVYYYNYIKGINKMEVTIEEEIDKLKVSSKREIQESDNNSSINNFTSSDNSVLADGQADSIGSSTKLIEISVDVTTDEKQTNVQKWDKKFYGYSLSDIKEYYEKYSANIPSEDKKKGIVGVNVKSFSKDEVVIVKQINSEITNNDYYVIAKDNIIYVYKSDKETFVENTNIDISHFPVEEQEHLKKGFFIEDGEVLFDILENYSS